MCLWCTDFRLVVTWITWVTWFIYLWFIDLRPFCGDLSCLRFISLWFAVLRPAVTWITWATWDSSTCYSVTWDLWWLEQLELLEIHVPVVHWLQTCGDLNYLSYLIHLPVIHWLATFLWWFELLEVHFPVIYCFETCGDLNYLSYLRFIYLLFTDLRLVVTWTTWAAWDSCADFRLVVTWVTWDSFICDSLTWDLCGDLNYLSYLRLIYLWLIDLRLLWWL